MEDHHVDRPDVEAQQCVKLTGTNRSIGLTCSHRQGACAKRKSARSEDRKQTTDKTIGHLSSSQFCFSSDEKRPTMEDRRYPFSVVRRPFFAGLVALSEAFKTRSHPELGRQKPQAPMVLCLKTWESRSSPGPPRTHVRQNVRQRWMDNGRRKTPSLPTLPSLGPPKPFLFTRKKTPKRRTKPQGASPHPSSNAAGWSSPVARQAHNLKAAGSNPAPATLLTPSSQGLGGVFPIVALCGAPDRQGPGKASVTVFAPTFPAHAKLSGVRVAYQSSG